MKTSSQKRVFICLIDRAGDSKKELPRCQIE